MGFNTIQLLNESIRAGNIHSSQVRKLTNTVSGTAGHAYSFYCSSGTPTVGTYAGSSLALEPLSKSKRSIALPSNNASCYLKGYTAYTSNSITPLTLFLVDIVGFYAGILLVDDAQQNLTSSVALPRYATGEGVMMFLEAMAPTGADPYTISYSYTNEKGDTGRVNPTQVDGNVSMPVTGICHSGIVANKYTPFLPLAAGDLGVRSVQNITIGGPSEAGIATLVLCKPIAAITVPNAVYPCEVDFTNTLLQLPEIKSDSCLSLVGIIGAANNANIELTLDFVW